MRTKAISLALAVWAGGAAAQAPLSAIDWLETRRSDAALPGAPSPVMVEPPVASSAGVPDVSVVPLDAPSVAAVGLLPSRVTGLPPDLWRGSSVADLRAALNALDVTAHPPLTALLYTLLLAEAEPPVGAAPGAGFLADRVQKLLDLGAVEPAQALLERAGPESPDLFPMWFELSLLTDRATEACAALHRAPHLTRDASVRVFCAARLADWPLAMTTLQTATALGEIDAEHGDLLLRFLDPELAEERPVLRAPDQPDAMIFRLYEAIGQRLTTPGLPRRFSVVDLGGDAGWKAQVEAAERLARVGAVSENRLLGYYADRRPAASGGVWDRVAAVQALDAALTRGDAPAALRALEKAWPVMRDAGLGATLANLFGPRLAGLAEVADSAIGARVALLSPVYEDVAAALPQTLDNRDLLAAVARGSAPPQRQRDPLLGAIAQGFATVALPDRLAPLLQSRRLGEAILSAMALVASGSQGNAPDLRDGLTGLRALGLEDTARRAALHILLVELVP